MPKVYKYYKGTKAGGERARETNLYKYGSDFYKRIGSYGGRAGRGKDYKGGFACDKKGPDGLTGKERAAVAGKKGGSVSRRGKTKKTVTEPIPKPVKQPKKNIFNRLFK